MMDKFNTNNSSLDYSALEDLFVRQGTLKEFARNDYFLRQNDHTLGMSYRGCFAYPVWMQMRMSGSSDIALSTTSYAIIRR